MRKKQIIILFILLSFVFVGSGDTAGAQGGRVGIKVSPVKLEEVVAPGSSIRRQLTVTNNSNEARPLYAYLRDFRAEGEEGKPDLIAPGEGDEYSLAAWIEVNGDGIEFGPMESKNITFDISVPKEAGPGGYYGAVLFGTQPPRLHMEGGDKGAGLSISQQTGVLVLLRVQGEANEESRIREFTTSQQVYGTPYDVEFLVRVENLGNVHAKPAGAITITNMFGKEIDRILVNEAGSNVLPRSIRRYTENWQGESGFGRYTANLGMSYGVETRLGGQGKQSLFSELTFWIIPWRIVIPALLVLIFLTAFAALLLRLYRNTAVRRAMERAGLGQVKYVKKYQGPSPALHFTVVLLVVLLVIFLIMMAIYFVMFA